MDMELCAKFANGRCTASGGHLIGKDFEKALARGERWLPKVAGRYVTNTKRKNYGYKTREGALKAARQYRDKCRAYLNQ